MACDYSGQKVEHFSGQAGELVAVPTVVDAGGVYDYGASLVCPSCPGCRQRDVAVAVDGQELSLSVHG